MMCSLVAVVSIHMSMAVSGMQHASLAVRTLHGSVSSVWARKYSKVIILVELKEKRTFLVDVHELLQFFNSTE